eukprot:scaffold70262_cov63-Phaeocystis_antarctica.AAC.1
MPPPPPRPAPSGPVARAITEGGRVVHHTAGVTPSPWPPRPPSPPRHGVRFWQAVLPGPPGASGQR